MMKNLKGITIIVVVALLVVLGAVGFANALNGSPTYVFENIEEATFVIGNASQDDFEDSISLGASGTRFPNGISADTTSPSAGEVRGITLTLTGAANVAGTTTIPLLDASLQTALDWSNGTTSTEVVVLAKVRNTGADLLCTDVWLDLSTTRTTYGGDLGVGTTTIFGDDSVVATTTATLIAATTIATTSDDVLNKQDEEGTNAEETWVWSHNDYIMATDLSTGAVSSSDLTIAGGFTGVGKLNVNCRNRF